MKFINNHDIIVDYEILENAIMFKFPEPKIKNAEIEIHYGKDGYAFICVCNQKCAVHRIIGEYMIGAELDKKLFVHHIDKNKKNNSINNLQVMQQSLHNQVHSGERNTDIEVILKHQKLAADSLKRKDVTEENVKKLHDMGYGYRRIAKILNCSRNTVRRRLGVLDVYGYKPKVACANKLLKGADENG